MKRLLTALALLLLLSLPALADVETNPGGQGPTGATASLPTIAAASTLVTLTAPSKYITVVNTSATATVYWSEVSPATVTSGPILPNAAYSYSGVPLSQFWLITSAGNVPVGVIAH